MKKKIFYIISISASLAILIFLNGKIIVFTEINKDEQRLILRKERDYGLDFPSKLIFKNNIEKPVGIVDSAYSIPTIIIISIIIIGTGLFLIKFFINTITIRGLPRFLKY